MPIEFKCSSCNKTIRVPDIHAGKKGHCPACNTMVRIPAAGASNSTAIDKVKSGASSATSPAVQTKEAPPSVPVPVPASAPSPAPGSSASTSGKNPGVKPPAFITFTCPSCDKRTGFPASLAGRAAPCPVCQANIMVPAESDGQSFVVGSRQAPAVQAAAAEAAAKRSPAIYAVGGLAVAGLIFGIAFIAGKLGQSAPAQVAQVSPTTPPSQTQSPSPTPAPAAPAIPAAPVVLVPSTRDKKTTVVDKDAPPQESNELPPMPPSKTEEPVARSTSSDEPKEVPFAQKVAEQMAAAEAAKKNAADNAAPEKKSAPTEDDVDVAAPKKT